MTYSEAVPYSDTAPYKATPTAVPWFVNAPANSAEQERQRQHPSAPQGGPNAPDAQDWVSFASVADPHARHADLLAKASTGRPVDRGERVERLRAEWDRQQAAGQITHALVTPPTRHEDQQFVEHTEQAQRQAAWRTNGGDAFLKQARREMGGGWR